MKKNQKKNHLRTPKQNLLASTYLQGAKAQQKEGKFIEKCFLERFIILGSKKKLTLGF